MTINRRLLRAVAAVIAIGIAILSAAPARAAEPADERRPDGEPRPEVALSIAAVIDPDGGEPALAFTLTNRGAAAIDAPAFARGDNGCVVLTPGGRVSRMRSVVDLAPEARAARAARRAAGEPDPPAEVIAPGADKTWLLPVAKLVERTRSYEAGTYRVYFEYRGVRSAEFRLLRRAADPHQTRRPWEDEVDEAGRRRPVRERWDTPRRALETFYRGLAEGNPIAVEQSLHFRDESSTAAAMALRNQAAAAMMLRLALERHFGPVPDYWAVGDVGQAVGKVRDARITYPEHFDTAVADMGFPCRLVLDGSRWKLVAANFLQADGRPFPQFEQKAKAIHAIRQRVEAGEFATQADANAALYLAVNGWEKRGKANGEVAAAQPVNVNREHGEDKERAALFGTGEAPGRGAEKGQKGQKGGASD